MSRILALALPRSALLSLLHGPGNDGPHPETEEEDGNMSLEKNLMIRLPRLCLPGGCGRGRRWQLMSGDLSRRPEQDVSGNLAQILMGYLYNYYYYIM